MHGRPRLHGRAVAEGNDQAVRRKPNDQTPVIEVQDIFEQYGLDYLHRHNLSFVQSRAFRDILHCRTAALGSHADICDECGFQRISYNSCRNRHCPKCQTLAKEKWIEKQEQNLLNVGYFHLVFTILIILIGHPSSCMVMYGVKPLRSA